MNHRINVEKNWSYFFPLAGSVVDELISVSVTESGHLSPEIAFYIAPSFHIDRLTALTPTYIIQ